jgi:hypothetical protein
MANIPFSLSGNEARALFDLSEAKRFEQLALEQSRGGGNFEDFIETNKSGWELDNVPRFKSQLYPNAEVSGSDLYRAQGVKVRWGDRPPFFKFLNPSGDVEDTWHMSPESASKFQKEGYYEFGGRQREPVLYIPTGQVRSLPLKLREDWTMLSDLDTVNNVPEEFQYTPRGGGKNKIGIVHPNFFMSPKEQMTTPLLPSQFDPRYYLQKAAISSRNMDEMLSLSRYLQGVATDTDTANLSTYLLNDPEERLLHSRGKEYPTTAEGALRQAKKEGLIQTAWERNAREAMAQYGRELIIDARRRDNPKLNQYLETSEEAFRDARSVIPTILGRDLGVNHIPDDRGRIQSADEVWKRIGDKNPASLPMLLRAIKAQERYNGLLLEDKNSGTIYHEGEDRGNPRSKGGRLGMVRGGAFTKPFNSLGRYLSEVPMPEGMPDLSRAVVPKGTSIDMLGTLRKHYLTNPSYRNAVNVNALGKAGTLAAIATAPFDSVSRKESFNRYLVGQGATEEDLWNMHIPLAVASGLETAANVGTLGMYDAFSPSPSSVERRQQSEDNYFREKALRDYIQQGIDYPVLSEDLEGNQRRLIRTTK